MKTKTAKDITREVLDELPDEASMDQILYRLDFRRAVLQGMAEVERGDVISQEALETELAEWLKSIGQ
jgi:hypothetical protein